MDLIKVEGGRGSRAIAQQTPQKSSFLQARVAPVIAVPVRVRIGERIPGADGDQSARVCCMDCGRLDCNKALQIPLDRNEESTGDVRTQIPVGFPLPAMH